MTLLVAMHPMNDDVLGIESMASYVSRLAGIYHVSVHQMIRYLCESSEVSNLVDESAFRFPCRGPVSLNGYSGTSLRLVSRLSAASGATHVASTTLQRIGPALSASSRESIVRQRRYCMSCLRNFLDRDDGIVWEPLIWSLATITCCPLHGVPLHALRRAWSEVRPSKGDDIAHLPDGKAFNSREDWRVSESCRLVAFCASDPFCVTPHNSPSVFINEYMKVNRLSVLMFSKIMGWSQIAIHRKIGGKEHTCLRTVFELADSLAVSPTNILSDPIGAARQLSLFSPSEQRTPVSSDKHARSILRSQREMTYDQFSSDLSMLLKCNKPLPPFSKLCRAHGVSTGYARYHFPEEASRYLVRRSAEVKKRRRLRTREAYALAHQAILDDAQRYASVNLKAIEKNLRDVSGLPKHLLSMALSAEARRLRVG
jgi:hypothetical protein